MKRVMKYAVAAAAVVLGMSEIQIAGNQGGGAHFQLFAPAEAVVGRPATPGSVAGVARRTTRRIIRRGAYIASIPAGCAYGTYYGYHLYYCGGVYYQPSGNGFVIVYF